MSCNSQVFASPLVRLSDIANWRSGEDVTGNEMYKVAQFSRYRAPLLIQDKTSCHPQHFKFKFPPSADMHGQKRRSLRTSFPPTTL